MKKQMKNLILPLIILAGTMSVTANSYADDATLDSGNTPIQLVLDTELAIANAQVSTITPPDASSQVILKGGLDNDGTFRQTPGTRAEFNFTSTKSSTPDGIWFRNIKQGQTDREWFQDVEIVFEKMTQINGYYVAQVASDKSTITICSNPAHPICFKFKPFGESFQPIQSTNDITYYIMAPVADESHPSIMFQFKLNRVAHRNI